MTAYSSVRPMTDFRPVRAAQTEWQLRQQLAAAYRLFDHFGWTMLIYGHITVRVPGPERHFLINPFGLRYDEVTASNLVKIDLDGRIVGHSAHPVNPAGFIIHGAVHAARDDAHCVMHTHTLAGMTFAATDATLRNLDFAGTGFHDRVAYHGFAGVHADTSDRESLVADLGRKNVMVLRNHGLLSCGPTIPSAFKRLYNLETACQVQVAAMALNTKLVEAPPDVAETHARVIEGGDDGELAFAALYRLMQKRDPSFLE